MTQQYDKTFQSMEFSFRGKAVLIPETIQAHHFEATRAAVEAVSNATAKFIEEEVTKSTQSLGELEGALSILKDQSPTMHQQLDAVQAQITTAANNVRGSVQTAAQQVSNIPAVRAAIDNAAGPEKLHDLPTTQVAEKSTFAQAVSNLGERIKTLGTGGATSKDEIVLGNLIATLNQNTAVVAEKIEKGIQEILPPYITVKADVGFTKGSIVITGTILLLDWIGAAIFQAGKEAFEEEFGSAVKLVVKRAFSDVMNLVGLTQYLHMDDVTVTVKPRSVSTQEKHQDTVQDEKKPQNSVRPFPSVGQAVANLLARSTNAQIIQWIILIGILILLADRFLTISLKP